MAPLSLKQAALAALSFCALLVQATPVPVADAEVDKRQASGYKNIVYFTNWWVAKYKTSDGLCILTESGASTAATTSPLSSPCPRSHTRSTRSPTSGRLVRSTCPTRMPTSTSIIRATVS
jgi:hypothetical protein